MQFPVEPCEINLKKEPSHTTVFKLTENLFATLAVMVVHAAHSP